MYSKELQSQARNCGRQWAPIFVHCAQSSLEGALRQGLNTIYCFTREGIFFAKLFKEIQRIFADRYLAIDIRVLAISRLVSYAPSLDLEREIETGFQGLFSIYPHQSLSGFLVSLGFSPDGFSDYFKKQALPVHQIIKNLNQSAAFKAFISTPEIKAKLKCQLATKRERFQAYLQQEDFFRCSSIGIFDIGWRGSIQDNLARLFPERNFIGFYLGLHAYKQNLASNVIKQAYLYNANLQAADKVYAKKMGVVLPFEFLLSTPGGTIIDYALDKQKRIKPLTAISDAEDRLLFEYAFPFQEGVMQSLATCLLAVPSCHHPAIWEKMQKKDRRLAYRIVWNPSAFLLNYYDRLAHQEIFGLNLTLLSPVNRPNKMDYLRALFGRSKQRQQIKRMLMQSIWPQASLKKTFSFLYGLCLPFLKIAYLYFRHQRDTME